MALTFFHSKMFEVGNLPVLTSGNCVLKTSRVIKWPLKLRTLLKWFLRPKQDLFTFFEVLNTFPRTLVCLCMLQRIKYYDVDIRENWGIRNNENEKDLFKFFGRPR